MNKIKEQYQNMLAVQVIELDMRNRSGMYVQPQPDISATLISALQYHER